MHVYNNVIKISKGKLGFMRFHFKVTCVYKVNLWSEKNRKSLSEDE